MRIGCLKFALIGVDFLYLSIRLVVQKYSTVKDNAKSVHAFFMVAFWGRGSAKGKQNERTSSHRRSNKSRTETARAKCGMACHEDAHLTAKYLSDFATQVDIYRCPTKNLWYNGLRLLWVAFWLLEHKETQRNWRYYCQVIWYKTTINLWHSSAIVVLKYQYFCHNHFITKIFYLCLQ